MGQDFSEIQQFVARKHNISILRALLKSAQGTGFNDLIRETGPITPRILSTRLKELEKQGLVQKNLVLGAKPKIEYRSTQKAEGLRKAIAELEKWGAKVLSKK